MGLFSDPTQEWMQCAMALRLPVFPVTRPIEPATGRFEGVRKSLGPQGPGGHPDQWWLHGKRADIEFAVGGRTEIEGSGEERRVRHFTHWVAEIDPPLWLGLRVVFDKGGLVSQLFETNTPQFAAWDPARLAALFAFRNNDGRDPQEMLAAAFAQGLHAEVDDHCVRVRANQYVFDPAMVGSTIDGATLIAERLLAARTRLGPAQWELDAAREWGLFSGRHGMELDTARFSAHGWIEGSRASLRLLGSASPVTRFRLRYAQPLTFPVRITVGPPVGMFLKIFGVQDIELGDPQFDPVFRVAGQEQGVRQLVGSEVRRHLLALASRGASVDLQYDSLDVRVPGVLFRAAELEALAGETLAVVRGFWKP